MKDCCFKPEPCIKAELRNELRRLGSLKGLDYVYSKGKMRVADLCLLIAEGIAFNTQMIKEGTGNFAALYNVEMIVVTDPDPSSTNLDTTGLSLTLNTELSRSNVPLVAGKQMTVQVLAKTNFTNGVQITGRTLKIGADEALKTIKKAVAFVLPSLNDDGSPIQSGMTVNDIDAKVLDFMFCLLKGKHSVDDAEEDEAEDDMEAKSEEQGEGAASASHPPDWFFMGGLHLNCSAQWLLKKSAFCSLQLGTHT
jgi:hypothetical protein